MTEPPKKLARRGEPKEEQQQVDVSVIVQFQSATGDATGPQLDIPHNVTPMQLEVLLNGLLNNEEKLPYSFYIEEQELLGELGAHLGTHKLSVEKALRIVYQPQAVFRVRPVARCTSSIPGHSEAVLSVNFSPDGSMLASGSGDTTVRFWDLNTQTPKHECKGHKNWVLVVAWSPDATHVASGDMNGMIHLWDPKSGKMTGTCSGHGKWITSLAWEPAHKALPCLRFVSGSKDNMIKIWDADTRRCVLSFSNHTQLVTAVKWGGEGLIYSASRDCTISAWDATDGKLVRIFKGHGHWVNTLALSSEYVLRTGAYDHTGKAPADLEDAKKKAAERYTEATSGRPERLVSGSDDFTLCLYEPSTSKTPTARMTGHVQLINQLQLQVERRFTSPLCALPLRQVVFSPDGRYILSASFDKAVKLWDGLKGTFLATMRGHVGPVYQVAWSSDSRMFCSGSKDSTLKVWDLRTRKLKVDLPGHSDEVFTVDWSPDGFTVASGGKDRVLKLWRH
ncbi:Notchless [Tetrabaena socialis]|uniref:Notchless n=1 Tax=Tetrabaena socialis TaxID=47790 RepID=A0A2J7ZSY8_9CHLO|nr:Notchless [Tetrabaena socialis]|eukprot:PNH03382.1 Notchless [Tetrabaena socialis]